MAARDEIVEQALALPPEDRAFVVEQFEQSLTPHDGFATKEIAQAWSKEIDRRLEAYLSGETKGIPYEEAIAEARQALEERREKRSNGG